MLLLTRIIIRKILIYGLKMRERNWINFKATPDEDWKPMIEASAETEKWRQIDQILIVTMQIWMMFIDIGRSSDREFLGSMVAIYVLVPRKDYNCL